MHGMVDVNAITRRTLLSRSSWLAVAAAVPAWATPASLPIRILNVVDLGADPSGRKDSTAAVQAAIDQLTATGGTVYLPAGEYRITRTLEWKNLRRERSSGILFLGDGMHASSLKSDGITGPLLRVRGVPTSGKFSTTFFWGGGIQQLTLNGTGGAKEDHDAVEVLGWWYGRLEQLRIHSFSRHGIRAITDLQANPNPDFSASTLFATALSIERCGGWGFKDDGGVQASPSWTWSHCLFTFCGQGGAYVQSSAHAFTRCSFSACGWSSEKASPTLPGYGLFFDGAATAASREWVEGCEFDNNYTAHIGLRFASSSSFINNRFIFNDRYGAGHLCPGAGVQIGAGDAKAALNGVEFRQNLFRFDKGGEAVAFDWVNSANVVNIDVQRSVFADNSSGSLRLTRYKGYENKKAANRYVVTD